MRKTILISCYKKNQNSSRIINIQFQGAQFTSLNFFQIAEIEYPNIDFQKLNEDQLDYIELKLLEKFQKKFKPVLRQNTPWYHWDLDYGCDSGFELIQHRWDLLVRKQCRTSRLSLPRPENRISLKQQSTYLLEGLEPGEDEFWHLAKTLKVSTENLLNPQDENLCFETGDWKDIALSVDAKMQVLRELTKKLEASSQAQISLPSETELSKPGFWRSLLSKKDDIAVANNLSAILQRLLPPSTWDWVIATIFLPFMTSISFAAIGKLVLLGILVQIFKSLF